jgi:hypothetical protein
MPSVTRSIPFENTSLDYKEEIHLVGASFPLSSSLRATSSSSGANWPPSFWGIYLCYEAEINAGTFVLSFTFVNMMVWPLRECAPLPFEHGPIHRFERPGPPHS